MGDALSAPSVVHAAGHQNGIDLASSVAINAVATHVVKVVVLLMILQLTPALPLSLLVLPVLRKANLFEALLDELRDTRDDTSSDAGPFQLGVACIPPRLQLAKGGGRRQD